MIFLCSFFMLMLMLLIGLIAFLVFGTSALYIGAVVILHYFFYKKNTHKQTIPDKVVVVTGGTAGIGKQTVYEMTRSLATVVFTGRNVDAAREIVEGIKNQISKMNDAESAEYLVQLDQGEWNGDSFNSKVLYFRRVDMSSLRECFDFTDWFKDKFTQLDILVNNAGLAVSKKMTTAQGYEMTMGVNHVATVAITQELLPLIEATPQSRVLLVSSIVHRGAIPFISYFRTMIPEGEDITNTNAKFSGFPQYCLSKLANGCYAIYLSKYFEKKGVEAKAAYLHPGVIYSSFTRDQNFIMKILTFLIAPLMRTETEGAQTQIFLSKCPYDELISGEYYSNCKVNKTHNPELDNWQKVMTFIDKTFELIKKDKDRIEKGLDTQGDSQDDEEQEGLRERR